MIISLFKIAKQVANAIDRSHMCIETICNAQMKSSQV